MNLFSILKEFALDAKRLVKEDSFDSVLRIVNVGPGLVGFSCRTDRKISAWFWILHLFLLFYVYAVGSFWYQWKYAHGADDFIKSYVNVSVLILTANNSWWFIMQRSLLLEVVKKLEQSDQMARRRSISLQQKHKHLIKIIKRIVFFFYGFNCVTGVFIYWPQRIDVRNNYSMTPCVGIESVTITPNKEVCLMILGAQEFTITIVALNYQALLLFLIAHTAAMFQMMAYEMTFLSDNYYRKENKELAKETLLSLIDRHALLLELVDKLKSLYSVPIGVNFGSNAVCMSLFFFLELRESISFIPILVFSFIVFFLYCYLGQRLINSSEVFERSVYGCGWENFDLKDKKMVFVMLFQSQKPVELLAADIIPVNIRTFATTLQAMYKFVTVVKF